MKKKYLKPSFEIEIYQLDANIASNCTVVVTMGDYGGNLDAGEIPCNDYLEMVGLPTITGYSLRPYNVNFWEHTCDCYTTAGGAGFFTS